MKKLKESFNKKCKVQCIVGLIMIIYLVFLFLFITEKGITTNVKREATIVAIVHEHTPDNSCYKNGKHEITGNYEQIHKVTFEFDDSKRVTKYCDILSTDLFNIANENVGKRVICTGYYIHKYILPKEYKVIDIEEVLD